MTERFRKDLGDTAGRIHGLTIDPYAIAMREHNRNSDIEQVLLRELVDKHNQLVLLTEGLIFDLMSDDMEREHGRT